MQNDIRYGMDRYFTGRMFIRQYIPSLIAAVVLSFGDVADSLVLGNSIGYIGLAALAMTMPVCQVFNIIMNALAMGGSVRFSNHMARGRRETARAGFQGVVCVTLLSGLGIALLGNLLMTPLLGLLGASPADGDLFVTAEKYLRILLWGSPVLFLNYVLNDYMKADDLEKQASAAFTAGNIVDIALNIVLVLFLRMGVVGAGLATVAGQAVGVLISLVVIWRRSQVLTLRKLKPDFSEARKSFQIGFSASVSFFYSLVYLLVANNLLIRTTGGLGAAVLDVLLSVSYFMTNLYGAVASSILFVISTYHGERNQNGMRLAVRTGLFYTLVTGLLLGAAVCAFPEGICRFFGMDDPAGLMVGRDALRIYSLSIPLAGISLLLTNVFEARQQKREALLFTTFRGVLRILAAVSLALLMPDRFWFMYVLAELLTLLGFGIAHRLKKSPPEDASRVFQSTIFSSENEISRTSEEIEAFCERWGANPAQRYVAMMAVEEICVATLNSGFHGRKDGFIQIVLVALEEGGFELHIRDNAASFNPLAMELNGKVGDESTNLDALGIMMIKKRAKDFSYRHFQGFNTVIIQI